MFKINFRNESFLCPDHMSVIEAAKIQNAKVPYGCIGGGCGICKMKVVDGQYRIDHEVKNALTDEEQKKGYVFLCRTYPLSDLQLELIGK